MNFKFFKWIRIAVWVDNDFEYFLYDNGCEYSNRKALITFITLHNQLALLSYSWSIAYKI